MARRRTADDDACVRVRGARENNLRNVDVEIPRDALVVFTGVSGSGKSSLAFGTLYAEAQRRYFESVAPYARRLIQQVTAPKVDEITGLPPAVALQQRRGAPSSRSTVGTLTTLSNLLRLLYSRAGTYPRGAAHLEAEAFSPNTVAGACPECHGLGRVHRATEATLVPDPSLSIREGAIAAWPGGWQGRNLRDIVTALGIDVDTPWRRLPKRKRDWLLFTEEQPVVLVTPEEDRNEWEYNGTFWGAERYIMRTLATSKSQAMRDRALRFVQTVACPTCKGSGLQPAALRVQFAARSIAEVNALPLADAAELLRPTADLATDPDAWGEGERSEAAVRLCRDLVDRIEVLLELGLGYLSMGRATTTLSPGEMQRLRIATQLRSGLFGVVYVLDEPSAGLHPADAEPLLAVLDRLKAAGNSLFVVEHDMEVVRRADWVVDVGPGAGEHGGRVLYSGPVAGLEQVRTSVTRRFLFGERVTAEHDRREPTAWVDLHGITRHNLRGIDARIPLGVLTAVTGVSGSGKSTLVTHVLADVVRAHLGGAPDEDDVDAYVETQTTSVDAIGIDAIDRLVRVDQRPIGRTPRSNLATYTGLFDAVRKAFAGTRKARARRYTAGRFSFNVAAGRCETCQGDGFVAVELIFLPGTYAACPTCHGARYNDATLEVTYRGKNIADVLGMTVDEAADFFHDLPGAARSLATLQDVGLGYLRLGQPATELSGGEAQRIKLATELQRTARGHVLYVLDEPTSGLHPADVEVLLRQLHRLVDSGHTVVVVEHDLDVIATADWVIDLGPGGGDAGGRIVAAGPPSAVARVKGSATAPYLTARLG
ncbi:MAG: excinuclease subunit [Frankiales bacterium]|nr:excinuclease subunit [Frankiales bacterium]